MKWTSILSYCVFSCASFQNLKWRDLWENNIWGRAQCPKISKNCANLGMSIILLCSISTNIVNSFFIAKFWPFQPTVHCHAMLYRIDIIIYTQVKYLILMHSFEVLELKLYSIKNDLCKAFWVSNVAYK